MKHPKPVKPDQHKYRYTEGIDYLKTGKRSIWISGDPKTLKVLKPLHLKGTWLNLAAGDGRYNSVLLRKVHRLIAADIDPSALEKSKRNISQKFRKKFSVKVFDISKRFPMKTKSIDGIFCAGTLHLFPKTILGKIVRETDRILRPNGIVIIDFATHITRERLDGKPYVIHGEPHYTNREAERTLRKMFKGYKIKFWESQTPEESYPRANPPYSYKSKFLIMIGTKSSP